MELLESKLPKWRVEAAFERFMRRGYLLDLGDGMLAVGWRALAEVDQKELIKAVSSLSTRPEQDKPT
ncbi:MAG: hypothetical protein RMK31_08085 [Candidatus Caldarchaeum sp.]|nr:hypothetical protein [Candidatus Caldarchaeum sp.]